MLTSFLFAVSLGYLLPRLSTLFHELGHSVALFISKKVCNYPYPLDISIVVTGFYGKTFSPFYDYLANNTTKYKNTIRLNALAGSIFDLVFLFLLIFVSFQLFTLYGIIHAPIQILCFYFCTFLLLVTNAFCFFVLGDLENIKNPQLFSYDLSLGKNKTTRFVFPCIIYLSNLLLCVFYFLYNKGAI